MVVPYVVVIGKSVEIFFVLQFCSALLVFRF